MRLRFCKRHQHVLIYFILLYLSGSICGAFHFNQPVFCVIDAQAIQSITVTAYEHFLDHKPFVTNSSQVEPLFGNSLPMLTGDRWRDMRTTLTPAFTGSKIRRMYPLVADCCAQYMRALLASAHQPDAFVVEMKDLTKRYLVDVISSTAFGYQVDSWRDRHNVTYTTAMNSMHYHSSVSLIKIAMCDAMPTLSRLLGIRLTRPEHVQFYHRLVHDTMAYRERHGIVRPDMVHLLAEARRGFLRYEADNRGRRAGALPLADHDGETGAEDVHGAAKRYWNEDDVTAQCYLFFFAGAENTSTVLSFVAQELLENQLVQMRLRAELDAAKALLAGDHADGVTIPFDTLMTLPYLDAVVLETLRKWPPTAMLDRICVKDYALCLSTGQTVQIRRGDLISIPVHAIHHDAQYYVEPERFDPERFLAERRHTMFLALGQGPRNCIGWRYAMMTVKTFLYQLLTTFTLDVCAESQIPAQTTASGMMLKVKGGIRIRLTPRVRAGKR